MVLSLRSLKNSLVIYTVNRVNGIQARFATICPALPIFEKIPHNAKKIVKVIIIDKRSKVTLISFFIISRSKIIFNLYIHISGPANFLQQFFYKLNVFVIFIIAICKSKKVQD